MTIKPADVAAEYSIAMVKKSQDEERAHGEQAVRLIEAAGMTPQKRTPPPDATVSVIA